MEPRDKRKEEECYLCLGRFLLLSVVLEIKTVRMGGCPAQFHSTSCGNAQMEKHTNYTGGILEDFVGTSCAGNSRALALLKLGVQTGAQ